MHVPLVYKPWSKEGATIWMMVVAVAVKEEERNSSPQLWSIAHSLFAYMHQLIQICLILRRLLSTSTENTSKTLQLLQRLLFFCQRVLY
jgi:hypothetical protein